MTELQISSGQGPAECELAVGKLLEALKAEYPGLQVLETVPGVRSGCCRSARVAADRDLSHLVGPIKWICKSPFRPAHRRKNWFVDVSLCAKAERANWDESLVRFETFRSGGKGGQHVNKVETGVRAVYVPTGLSVVSTEARSQHMNRKLALDRLAACIAAQGLQREADAKALDRLDHLRLERGNPVRVYEGLAFKRIR